MRDVAVIGLLSTSPFCRLVSIIQTHDAASMTLYASIKLFAPFGLLGYKPYPAWKGNYGYRKVEDAYIGQRQLTTINDLLYPSQTAEEEYGKALPRCVLPQVLQH